MRSGSFIQALGRQSFEPSQPPSGTLSGPAALANERQRELIKAQNDVLATVGVCLRDTKRDMEKTENTMAENEVGLAVGVLDLVFTYFSSWPLVGIRNRLQACGSPALREGHLLTWWRIVADVQIVRGDAVYRSADAHVEEELVGGLVLRNAGASLLPAVEPCKGHFSHPVHRVAGEYGAV